MFFTILLEDLSLFPQLPWQEIVIGTVAAYLLGLLWYGVFFKKQYMQCIENKEEKTNWIAMAVQLFALFLLAYIIGVFTIFEETFLLGIDALMGITIFMTLAGVLFQRGNTRKAIRFWLITAGYEVIAIGIIALIMWHVVV